MIAFDLILGLVLCAAVVAFLLVAIRREAQVAREQELEATYRSQGRRPLATAHFGRDELDAALRDVVRQRDHNRAA